MSSFLILANDKQQDDKIKKLHSNFNASLRYASSAQGIQPPRKYVKDIPHAERNTILSILTAAGVIPKGEVIELGGIFLHTRPLPDPAPASTHTLLTLPLEMRNRIYRFVLVEPQNIVIRANEKPPEEPALLATCRQVRQESLNIYWKENNFEIEVRDYLAAFYARWCTKSKDKSDSKYNCTHTFTLLGRINWWNLKAWLRACYNKECRGLDADNANEEMAVAAHLFDIVESMSEKCSWYQVAEVLKKTVPVLQKQNPAW
ncbi:hypothetical protein LTR85_006803 [Meristemomyces frigidus]|nr:hypothetical protein LTR85_006803 [Meristemomyces frigidus]